MDTEIETKKTRSAPRYWVEKNGSLYARFQYRDENGRGREKYRKIDKKTEAKRTVENMRREFEDYGAETLNSDKLTFEELAAEYEAAKVFEAVYSNSIKIAGLKSTGSVRSSLNNLKAYFGKRKIRDLRVGDIEKYKRDRLAAPVVVVKNVREKIPEAERTGRKVYRVRKVECKSERKISGVNRDLETLRAMLNFAIENDWLMTNPFSKKKGIISKAAENERERIVSREEEKRLLSHCTGKRAHIKPILICALDTGMRRGEIFKMRWKHVDLETGEIFIPKTNTKTESERIVGMTSRLKAELKILWENSPKKKEMRVMGIRNTIKNAWDTLLCLSEIENLTFHDSRHTATTRMIAAEVAHTEVMKITGHTQLKTFLRYLNITQETAQKCASKLDEYLEQTAPGEDLKESEPVRESEPVN